MALFRKTDFAGGMTDEFINGRINCAQKMENLLIDRNKKAFTRYGSDFYLKDRMSWETAIQSIRQPILVYDDVTAIKDLSSAYGTYTPTSLDRILVSGAASVHADWGTIIGLTARTRIETGYTVDYVMDDLSDPYGTRTTWVKYDETTSDLIVTVEASVIGNILNSRFIFYLSVSPTIDITDSYYYFNTYELLCDSAASLNNCITAWNASTFTTEDPVASFTVTKGPIVDGLAAMSSFDLGAIFDNQIFTRTAGSAGIDPVEGMKILVKSATGVHADYGVIAGLGDGDIIEYSGGAWSVVFDVSAEGYDEYDWPIVDCGTDEYGYAYGEWTLITSEALEPVAIHDIIEYDGVGWSVVVDASDLDTNYYYKVTSLEDTFEYFYVDDTWSLLADVLEAITITLDIDETVVDMDLVAVGDTVTVSGSSMSALNGTHTITDISTNFGLISFQVSFFDSSVTDTGTPIVTYLNDKAQLAYGAGRIDRIKYFDGEVLRFQGRSVFDDNGDEILGTNQLFGNLGSLTDHISIEEWKNHLYCASDAVRSVRKIFRDEDGNFQIHTAGLPQLASDPVFVPATPVVSQTYSYIYMFCYENAYMTDGVAHLENGATRWAYVYSDTPIGLGAGAMEISEIPELVSGVTENYPTDVKVAVYRTVNGGTIGYFSGYASGTSYTDTVTDGEIRSNAEIYITGGVADNDPPPACKYIAQTNGVGWFLGCLEDGEFKGYRIRQSKQGNLDAAPASWYTDLDADTTGGRAIKNSLIAFEEGRSYRLDGMVSSLGTGSIYKTVISHTIGCISNNGIVQVDGGLIFPSLDGFYFTDGYKVHPISKHLPYRYAEIIAEGRGSQISGVRNKDGRIYWTVQEDGNGSENDAIWVLDTSFGLTDRSTFTSITGQDWKPTALEVVDGNLLRADASGCVFEHKEDYYADRKLIDDVGDVISTSTTVPVIYDYIGISNSFGEEGTRSWFTKFQIQAYKKSNLTIQPLSINDITDLPQKLKPIRYRGHYVWGDPEVVWGEEDAVWNDKGMAIGKRRFPANKLRATYKAMELTNSPTIHQRSNDSGGCVVDSTTKIATLLYGYTLTTEEGRQINTEELQDILTESIPHNWPTAFANDEYYITFSIDGYDKMYKIGDIVDEELTFEDLTDDSVTCETKWMIQKYARNERLHIDSYMIEYHKYSDSHDFFTAGEDGSNA